MTARIETALVVVCLATLGVASEQSSADDAKVEASTAGDAAAAQHNETDLEFSKRMTRRVEQLQLQIGQLEETLERNRFQMQDRSARTPSPSSQDDFLRESRSGARSGTVGDDYGRFKRRLSSLHKKAEKERKRLQAPQGSQSKAQKLDRESIEKNVKKVQRGVEDLQRDLYRR